MKFFIDTANLDDIAEAEALGVLDGVTTNPSLMAKEGITGAENILNHYKNDNLKILMHCFTGSREFAEKLLTLNSFFSASGIITFKNTTDLQNIFKSLPLDKILIETDSPFLAPIPYRGKKNEPSFIDFTAQKLAEIKEVSKQELIKITTKNFNNLFFN